MMLRRASVIFLWLAFMAVLITAGVAMQETHRRSAQLNAEASLAETRHGNIEYIVWGEGPPVLVVHGAGGGFDQGRLLANAVGGEGFTYISVSRFGYLGSDMPSDASTNAQAEAFLNLLDALNIESAHVLAMSGGVPPILKFAERYPERAGRLVLLSSAPFTPFGSEVDDRPMPTWVYSALLGNDVVYWLLTKIAHNQLKAAFDAREELYCAASNTEKVFVDELIDGFLPASKRVKGVNNEGAAIDPKISYNLSSIQSSALIIHALDDRLNPFEISRTITAGIQNARLISLESGGHLLLGHHSLLRREIDYFLASDNGR